MHPDWRSRCFRSACYVAIIVALIGLIGIPILALVGIKILIAAAVTISALVVTSWAILGQLTISIASLILLAGIAILRGWDVALLWYGQGWHRGLVEHLYKLMQ